MQLAKRFVTTCGSTQGRTVCPAGNPSGGFSRAARPAPRRQNSLRMVQQMRSYHERVIDHYENPRNVGSLDKADPSVGTGVVGAPACGMCNILSITIVVTIACLIHLRMLDFRFVLLRFVFCWFWFCFVLSRGWLVSFQRTEMTHGATTFRGRNENST